MGAQRTSLICCLGKVERDKYFTEDGSGFNEGGEERLKLRMRETYDNIFTSCKSMGITYPSFLAMGLGMFLPKGDQFQTLRDLVRPPGAFACASAFSQHVFVNDHHVGGRLN